MSAAIIPFDFESHAVRSVMQDGKPLFVAADACRILEHSNTVVALRRVDDDQKGVIKLNTLGGEQTLSIVSQGGAVFPDPAEQQAGCQAVFPLGHR